MTTKTKILAASAYLFGIPALYIVLALGKKDRELAEHGSRAMFLWCGYFLIFFGLRFLINFIWRFRYLPALEWLEIAVVLFLAGHAIFSAVKIFINKPA